MRRGVINIRARTTYYYIGYVIQERRVSKMNYNTIHMKCDAMYNNMLNCSGKSRTDTTKTYKNDTTKT